MPDLKKITFFGCDFPPTGGGISTYSYEWILTTAESELVSKAEAIIFGNRQPRKEVLSNKLNLHTFKSRNFFTVGILVFFYMVKNFRSYLFHSMNLFPVGFWVVFWSKILFRKSAITFYGTDACSSLSRDFTKRLKRWTINNASSAFTISEFTKQETSRVLGIKREIDVVYAIVPEKTLQNQSDFERFIDPAIEKDDFIVICVCRFVERKGLDLLIRAIGKIENKKIKAVLIGDGPERERLAALVLELNLVGRIIFTGKIENLLPYYERANVAVLLSSYLKKDGDFEGLGLVLIEAQYYGVPVIGTRSGGIPEALAPGRTGIVVPENDVDAISGAIQNMYTDKSLYKKMSEESKKFIYDKFNPGKIIDKYVANI